MTGVIKTKRKLDARTGEWKLVAAFYVDGKEVTKQQFDRLIKPTGVDIGVQVHANPKWPIASDAAGCHPADRKKFEDVAAERGVPTHFDSQGRAIFTSRTHRRAYMKAHGMHDNAGWGNS